ncbi:hypothetical protein C8Q78DRAFT_1081694 [Trametes maxima]|nr:hypothetical protein C8Q78DRAFT_1081694 [Trametes maxima]
MSNYDFPNNCEDYIHRIGRTGRAGMKGTSYTYFTTDNAKQARELIGILKEANAVVPPQLEEMSMFGGGGGGRSRYGGGRGRGGGGGGGGRYGGGGGGGGGGYGGHDNGYGGRNNDRWSEDGSRTKDQDPRTQSTVSKQTLVIAGITVNVFAQADCATWTAPGDVAVLFLLHGRTQSAETVEHVARSILEDVRERGKAGADADELIVVTFDHRNHGTRLVDARANWHWTDDPETTNVRHAIDMYAIQTGTAADVSFLIDFLPAYLFPNDERAVGKWLIAGISLGGHATWIVLKNGAAEGDARDPDYRYVHGPSRSQNPCVMCGDGAQLTENTPTRAGSTGCPEYLKLIAGRAAENGIVALAPPHFPASFVAYVRAHDPASASFTAGDSGANPFWGKKVLVLSGKEDVLVPWSASEAFVGALDVGEREGGGGGVKEVVVEEGTGHACSEGMVRRAAGFVWEHALVR